MQMSTIAKKTSVINIYNRTFHAPFSNSKEQNSTVDRFFKIVLKKSKKNVWLNVSRLECM